jgi:hypothetical protein
MAEALTPAQQLKNTLESLKVSNGKERDDMLTVFVDYYLSQTFVNIAGMDRHEREVGVIVHTVFHGSKKIEKRKIVAWAAF